MNSTKYCPRCQQENPRGEFPKSSANKDGLYGYCKPCHAANVRRYQKATWPASRERVKAWGKNNRERRKAQRNAAIARLREQCLDAYGHACACCGVTDSAFLALDHVNGSIGGRNRPNSEAGVTFYQRLKREEFPDYMRVLCHSCNMCRGFYGYCVHQGRPDWFTLSHAQRYFRRARETAVTAFGGACECCGETNWEFLAIHHRLKDGAAERKRLGLRGYSWFRYLREQGYPRDRYGVLCHSCHGAVTWWGSCPHQAESAVG